MALGINAKARKMSDYYYMSRMENIIAILLAI